MTIPQLVASRDFSRWSGARRRGAFFDWDGTVVDSYHADFIATSEVMRAFGIAFDENVFQEMMPNWRSLYRHLGIPEEEFPRAGWLFKNAYCDDLVSVFPAVEALVRTMKAKGFHVAILSNGKLERVRRQIALFELQDCIEFVATPCLGLRAKPHPEMLISAISHFGLRENECFYVGDSDVDLECAEAANVSFVGAGQVIDHLPERWLIENKKICGVS